KTCSQDKDCASITRAHCSGGFRCIRPFVVGKNLTCCGFCVCGSLSNGDSPWTADTCKSLPPSCL
ncbi:MAG: hypothetical protein KAI47_26650, partial [Deltaproteobacteria bacterium]|nr:hypothetical protein [Deltaproteobacteria bacterium]